jgi:hypothetical protein
MVRKVEARTLGAQALPKHSPDCAQLAFLSLSEELSRDHIVSRNVLRSKKRSKEKSGVAIAYARHRIGLPQRTMDTINHTVCAGAPCRFYLADVK